MLNPGLTNKTKIPSDVLGAIIAEAIERRQQRVTPVNLAHWIASEVTIEEPQGDNVSVIVFNLWPMQREALEVIQREQQVIILKARQLGMSWLAIVYALWLCLFHPNKLVMVFSKDQDSANEMVRRAKGIYQRLKHKPVEMIADNVTTLSWANGSRIKSFAATEDAGSSFTASLIIADEFAKMRYAEALYTAIKPTINDGGKMIIISTAKGEGNPFYILWEAAVKHLNNFFALFIPWTARPERDAAWYARTEADAISSAHHRQEYPAEPGEAFVSIGEDRFLPFMSLWDVLQESLPPATEHEPMIIALDGADVNDSFGLVGVTVHPDNPKRLAARIVYEWTPDRASGIIDHYGDETNPGPDWIIRNVLIPKYAVVQIVFDPHGLYQLTNELMRDGLVACVEFSQQNQRLDADKMLFDLISQRLLAHDGNPALRRHIDNADRKPDPESRKLRIVKRHSAAKIDLAVCLSMACHAARELGL